MSNGWAKYFIDDICAFRGGGTPSKGIPRYWTGDIPWVSPKDMKSDIVLDSIDHISEEAVEKSTTNRIPAGAVLVVVRSGILARTVPIAIAGRELAINQDIKALCPNGKVESRFLFYFLKSRLTEMLSLASRGATVHRIMADQIRTIEMPVPPLAEQRRIVGILDEAFAAIATAKANTEKNLQNARALFESELSGIFIKRAGAWKEKRLEDVAKVFGRGKSRHRPRNEPTLYGGKYPFIQTGDVRNADFVVESYQQTYSELGLAQSKLWPAGTVCITIAANIAETAILGFEACIPDSIIGLVVDDSRAVNKFVLYLLRSFKSHLQAQGKGSAQDNINMGTFENQVFPFPPLSDQSEIVARLDSLARNTRRLESLYQRKLAALDELKKSLLHQAFTGQL
jgi:type I restriction enzyme S subunit